jgi:hypothetical protein
MAIVEALLTLIVFWCLEASVLLACLVLARSKGRKLCSYCDYQETSPLEEPCCRCFYPDFIYWKRR